MENVYPCELQCYLLRARDGMPPHPEDDPIRTVTIHSQEEGDRVKKELKGEHPNSWLVEMPIT